jgi:hypothetical protein
MAEEDVKDVKAKLNIVIEFGKRGGYFLTGAVSSITKLISTPNQNEGYCGV